MDHDSNGPANTAPEAPDPALKAIDERFDIEAIVQLVEHLDYSTELSRRLTRAFADVNGRAAGQHNTLGAIQQELRELILDVALLKRAVTSLGQVGVMERRKIERELVRELLPPDKPRPGVGLVVISEAGPAKPVDCASRLHLCKAACCRLHTMPLTPQEVESDAYDWDPKRPYSLRKVREGCAHLKPGTCVCSVHASRPGACAAYSCENDARIWEDFEKKIPNRELEKWLAPLQVSVTLDQTASPAPPAPTRTAEARTAGPAPAPSAAPAPEPAPAPRAEQPRADAPPAVGPPNFDDLRATLAATPNPTRRFSPPKAQSSGEPTDKPN